MAVAGQAEDVCKALAQYVHDQGLARYIPAGTSPGYGADDPTKPAVFFYRSGENPITTLTLTPYLVTRARDDYNPDVYVQFRFRAAGSPFIVDALADRAFPILAWQNEQRAPLELTRGVIIGWCGRNIHSTATPGANNTWERLDAYHFHLNPSEE